MSDNINGGFPPLNLEIIKEYKKNDENKDMKIKRFYAPSNLNIMKILNTKKKETMINKEKIIDAIESL
jgi:hypothetical protein